MSDHLHFIIGGTCALLELAVPIVDCSPKTIYFELFIDVCYTLSHINTESVIVLKNILFIKYTYAK